MILAGCQSGMRVSQFDYLPYPQHDHRSRSVAFAPDDLRVAGYITADSQDVSVPWYAWRKDVNPTVTWGVQSLTVEQESTFVYERRSQYGDRVRDDLRIETYRNTYTESVR